MLLNVEKMIKPVWQRGLLYALGVMAALLSTPGRAQDRIFRCGNEYTNNVADAQARGCKQVAGGNVSVVQGHKGSVSKPVAAAASGPKVEVGEQRARDSDARAILEAELKKAESRLAEITQEYNGGTPDKRGDEARNHQKYLDRVAELKTGMARAEADVAGIKRELARLPAAK